MDNQETMLVVSTGHLKKGDAAVLNELAAEHQDLIWARRYGWAMPADWARQHIRSTPWRTRLPELLRVLTHCHEQGYDWLMLDSDGQALPGFDLHEW